jgi:nucleoside-diphosphate-sugar epimerase
VRDPDAVARAVAGQDLIIHLAYILPPYVEEHPKLAEEVNVQGTRNLVTAALACTPAPRFLFASSLDVFGFTLDQPPPRRVSDPVVATDDYSRQKIWGEQLVQDSRLTWAILRFADVPPLAMRSPHPIMFRIPWATRIEALHPVDAGLVVARAITDDALWNRIWLIGGGPTCQVTYGEYLGKILDAAGIGRLPESAFGPGPYNTDWLDTADGEARWHYQRHTFDDIVLDIARSIGPVRHIVPALRPLVRRRILRLSPFRNDASGQR